MKIWIEKREKKWIKWQIVIKRRTTWTNIQKPNKLYEIYLCSLTVSLFSWFVVILLFSSSACAFEYIYLYITKNSKKKYYLSLSANQFVECMNNHIVRPLCETDEKVKRTTVVAHNIKLFSPSFFSFSPPYYNVFQYVLHHHQWGSKYSYTST